MSMMTAEWRRACMAGRERARAAGVKFGRPKKGAEQVYPERWMEAVTIFEGGGKAKEAAAIVCLPRQNFYKKYHQFCVTTGREIKRDYASRFGSKPRQPRQPKEKIVPVALLPAPAWWTAKPAKKPDMEYYLSDEGMRAFLREGSLLAREVKSCARGGLLLMEGEDLRRRLKLNARDFIRLMAIAKEETA